METLPFKTPIEIDAFFSAFIRRCTTEYFFQGENHNFGEVAYVIKGSVCMTADGKVIELYENQIIFHKPTEFHSMRTTCPGTTEIFIMSFNANGSYINRFENSVNLDCNSKHRIFEIIEKLKDIPENPDDIFEPTASLECLLKNELQFRLITNLTENFLISLSTLAANGTEFIKNTETIIYANALKIIDDNIYSRLTVSQLATKSN
ncbi:MAG: AraC family ligand binding domain-containing protein [Clostridia bacterium]|nr:AraC family ligand binding domain-containing protein [Clostridia bacterium]